MVTNTPNIIRRKWMLFLLLLCLYRYISYRNSTQTEWLRNKIDTHYPKVKQKNKRHMMYRNKCEIYIWIELEGSEVIKFRNERVLITFEISCICWVFITVFFLFSFPFIFVQWIAKHHKNRDMYAIDKQGKNSAQTICFDCTRTLVSWNAFNKRVTYTWNVKTQFNKLMSNFSNFNNGKLRENEKLHH